MNTAEPGSPSTGRPPTAADARFEALFEHAPFSVQLLSTDGRTLRVNRAWKELWGVTPQLLHYVMSEYNVLQDPQLAARGVLPYVLRAFAGEAVSVPRNYYDPAELGKPGRARWVVTHLHPVRGADGALGEVMLIHEDVTDRVQAENALMASEERLKQLANTIPQLAWMADPGGNIHWYNNRWYAYTGTTPAEMRDGGWQRVHDPAALPQVLAEWQYALEHGTPVQVTFPLRGADGRFRPFLTMVAPLKDENGKVVQWFGTNTDVSPLHAAQAELQRAEERLRLATEAGDIGIWDWDVAADRVTWSDRVYRLHDVRPGEFGGTVADFAARVHPEDRDMVGRRIQAAVRSGDTFSAEFRVQLRSNEVRWLSTWAHIHRENGGQAIRMVGATISVDDYKKAEARLREGDRRKDEFLAMLAHELRNPLAPIGTAARLLRHVAHDPQRVQQASEIIDRQVRHISALVDDLLDVSRVTRGLIQLKPLLLDADAVAAAAVEQVRPLIEERGHTLQLEFAGGLPVQGDRTRLVQVVANLLNNAAKYTPPGGRIVLRLERRHGRARLEVSDNGSGISGALLPQVFELFTQGERTPDRSQGGLGIGLALVRSIVKMHGGEATAASEGPGRGSTFVVTLPLADAGTALPPSTPAAPATAAATAGGAQSLSILVVDDNVDAAQTLAQLLELEGHRVSVAADARSALARARSEPPHVFILDIGLPDMDGHALAQKLKESDSAVEALFIALTGYGQPRDVGRSQDAGFHHHFVKPVEPTTLFEVLRAATPRPGQGASKE